MVVTTGFTINAHYCDGKLVDFSVVLIPDICCEMEGGCCKTKSTTIQLEEDAIDLQYINLDHELSFEITSFDIEQFELADQNLEIKLTNFTQIKLLDHSVDLANIQSFRL